MSRSSIKSFPAATVRVQREDGRPVGSRIESTMGTFVVDHWPSKIADVRIDEGLGLLVVETKRGSRRFFGSEDALVETKAGGSAGGHDPRAHGKMRYIIRAFGEWADGKHEVCVKRIQTEHPEIAKGKNVNALCAWLKDQWAGTTKWRGSSKDPKQKAEDAAITAKARASAHSRFTHSMPMALDDPALDGLVEDVRAMTGIEPSAILARIAGADAGITATVMHEASMIEADLEMAIEDLTDVFEAIWEAEVELSAQRITATEVGLRECLDKRQFGELAGLLESWLALHGAPEPMDEDRDTLITVAERIVRGYTGPPTSYADRSVVEAARAAASPPPAVLPALTAEEVMAARPYEELSLTESVASLQARGERLLREADVATPERVGALRAMTSRLTLARAVRLLEGGEDEADAEGDVVTLHEGEAVVPLADAEEVFIVEVDGARYEEDGGEMLLEADAVHVSGYTTKGGKKVSSYWRGTGAHAGIKGKSRAEVVRKIAAKSGGAAKAPGGKRGSAPASAATVRGAKASRDARKANPKKPATDAGPAPGPAWSEPKAKSRPKPQPRPGSPEAKKKDKEVVDKARKQDKALRQPRDTPPGPSDIGPDLHQQANRDLVTQAVDDLYDDGISDGRKHQHLKGIAKAPKGVLEGMDAGDLVDIANSADELGHKGLSKRIDGIVNRIENGEAWDDKAGEWGEAPTGALDGYKGGAALKVGDVRKASDAELEDWLAKHVLPTLDRYSYDPLSMKYRKIAEKNKGLIADQIGQDRVSELVDERREAKKEEDRVRAEATQAARDAMIDDVAKKAGVNPDVLRAHGGGANDLRGYDTASPETIADHERGGYVDAAKRVKGMDKPEQEKLLRVAKANADHRKLNDYLRDEMGIGYRRSDEALSVPQVRKLPPEIQAIYLQSVSDEAYSSAFGDNQRFKKADNLKRRMIRAGFDLPPAGSGIPAGFQDSAAEPLDADVDPSILAFVENILPDDAQDAGWAPNTLPDDVQDEEYDEEDDVEPTGIEDAVTSIEGDADPVETLFAEVDALMETSRVSSAYGGWHGRAVRRPEKPDAASRRKMTSDEGYIRRVKGFSAGAVGAKGKSTGSRTKGGSKRVVRVQRMLKKLGYAVGKTDGIYGRKTRGAVRQFQRKHGIKGDPNGVAGTSTVRHMRYRRINSGNKGKRSSTGPRGFRSTPPKMGA